MKFLTTLACLFALALGASAASLEANLVSEALIVTKAELRRHLSAPEDDAWRPATYTDLEASRGPGQPDYLVVRFKQKVLGHYSGEAEARINGAPHGNKLNVMLHFNKGWVEYFVPLDGLIYGGFGKPGGPTVTVVWNSLHAK
ncbi:MAG: hypothetical protein QG602_923 [Verrucomicrobiota bacterium]|nr:hypothetical protein [Verrucomicrobiota bacterium]